MHFFNGFWENLCLFLVTCCMTVQSAIFYITTILGKFMFIFSSVLYDRAICYFLYYKNC